MSWFNNKKKRLEMIQGIKPTSKASLKLQCLFATKGDIDEAKKLYDFFAEDIKSLPDYDPVAPTWMDNTKDIMGGIFGWMKDNQDTLAQGYEFIRSIMQNKTLPPITPTETAEALPPINE